MCYGRQLRALSCLIQDEVGVGLETMHLEDGVFLGVLRVALSTTVVGQGLARRVEVLAGRFDNFIQLLLKQ